MNDRRWMRAVLSGQVLWSPTVPSPVLFDSGQFWPGGPVSVGVVVVAVPVGLLAGPLWLSAVLVGLDSVESDQALNSRNLFKIDLLFEYKTE